jgi:peptidoglycan hydrolase-like protein with peptidoglycan-binding domain
MKRILQEDLERIHRLNYKDKAVNEQFWDKLKEKIGIKKIDDAGKADLVTNDVDDFYKTLEDLSKTDGLTQQEGNQISYQKDVETMQMALILLGYTLPKHGVDGRFGPETAAAVNKFIQDNQLTSKSLNEAVNIVSQGGGIIGRPGHGTHNASDWQSGNAWDVTGPVGAQVFSITNGTVVKSKKASGGLVLSGVKKIFGDQVRVKSDDGKPDVFYTHINSSVNVGDKVKEGDVIGTIMQMSGIPSHVHVGLSSGNLDGLVTGLKDSAGGGKIIQKAVATPEMLKTLYDKIKERGITSDELKKLIDTVKLNASNINVDVKDWQGMVNLVIDKLEGGYYHPDMLKDGRVRDSRYSGSGETMFGLDRRAGNNESTPEGREFWAYVDSLNARSNWKWNYMAKDNPMVASRLRELAANYIKPFYAKNMQRFLSPEAAAIVNNYAPLAFNFIYATWNGEGWFQKFAKPLNKSVESGNTDPKTLNDLVNEVRAGSGNSLISQGAPKVASITNALSQKDTSSMA